MLFKGDAVEDGETETDKTESDQQQPPDSSTDSRQEQPPSEAERNNVTASGEKRTESSEPEKPSPLQEKIIRQIEVTQLLHDYTSHVITSVT